LTGPTTAIRSNPFDRPGPHLVMPGFLGPQEARRLLDFARTHEANFEPSTVSRPETGAVLDPKVRISSVMWPVAEIEPVFKARAVTVLERVFAALGVEAFEPSEYEIELAAHGDGAFFGQHIDTFVASANARPSSRVVSLVYYFCATPARFSGGHLRMHSMAASGAPGSYVDIAPENDTALFFPSWFPHEVLPVSCPSQQFMDSRFAVNCWLHKKQD